MNEYAEKTNTTIWFYGFRGCYQGRKEWAWREPQKGLRRVIYFSALSCEYWKRWAAAEFTSVLWSCNPLPYIRRSILFSKRYRKDNATVTTGSTAERYERYGNTDYNRNGKGNNGSRKNRGIIPLHGRLQRMAAAIFFCVKDKGTRNKYRLSNGIWSR